MNWETLRDDDALSDRAASILLDAITSDPKLVLGLPTGQTPVGMYKRVVKECKRSYRCFRDVVAFNLDEYVGIPRDHPGSYFTFMQQHLFSHVDIDPKNALIPNGRAPDLKVECERYERLLKNAGGLGLTFLGLGSNGHIAFNEPGTPFDSRTHGVALTAATRRANAAFFLDQPVPTHAITMGIATILESRAIVLLASGARKRDAIARLRSGEISPDFPASALWNHADVRVLVDDAAAASA
ncbi:MAG TPA: glucosamine-6-phosphate deaminase [Thermoanaerobaculia bacterium]|nr:glucosamine-6-phosphate deaminase [Thermoanaerobaculia bacterium]